MNEDPLRALLRSLPRESASQEFTARVMGRLGEARRPAVSRPHFALAAAAVLLVAGWVGAERWLAAREDERRSERIESLRREMQQLQKDITLLRDLAPVVYLGEDRGVDFVLDLRQLVADARESNVQPAAAKGRASRVKKGETRK